MKKADVFKGIVCLALIFVMFLFCGKVERTYSTKATVFSVENSIVTFEDEMGNLWEYEEENGRYTKGQIVKLIMDNNYTKEFEDDIIIKVK